MTISYQTYDTTLSIMGDLYKEGKISDTQKATAIELGKAYKLAHNEAVSALLLYEQSGGQANEQAYIQAVTSASSALAKLIAYCRPLIDKGGK